MRSSAQPYADNGVLLSKSSLNVGDEVLVTYSGLLAQSGADQIFVHVGYGESWQKKTFFPMENDNGIFKTAIKVVLPGVLNISFKDSANNWDNNSSNDYSFKVSEKEKSSTASKKATEVKKPESKVTEVKKPESKATGVKKPEPKATEVKKADTKASGVQKTVEKGAAKADVAKKTETKAPEVKKSAVKAKTPAKKK